MKRREFRRNADFDGREASPDIIYIALTFEIEN